jgi:hypothetical protein
MFSVQAGPAWSNADSDEVETLRRRLDALERHNAELTSQLKWVMEQLTHRTPAGESSLSAEDNTMGKPASLPAASQQKQTRAPQNTSLSAKGMLSALGQRITPYGFLRLDTAYNDARSDNGGFIDWVLPQTDQRRTRGEFTLDPRMTRLGLRFDGSVLDALGGAHLTGQFETDFYASDFGQGE